MNFEKLNTLKGFMPEHEGLALTKWAEEFSLYGPALEIGTFGAKSALYIAAGSSINNQLVYTIDHHSGSEEHQLGEEYFDPDIYDKKLGRVNTVPLMQANLQQFEESKWVVPILANANFASLKPWSAADLNILAAASKLSSRSKLPNASSSSEYSGSSPALSWYIMPI